MSLGERSIASGLRRAQLGAAWALGAHWTVNRTPAQIVLPTGSGKTLVMTLAPFLAPVRRVLVVAPSRIIRDQLSQAFTGMGDLKRADVVRADLPAPGVMTLVGRASAATWRDCRAADVVVANVQNISAHYDGVAVVPRSLFDVVIVDEGHHVPAPAWRALLRDADADSAFFTATPFRRDRRRIPGEVVYAYPVRQAIRDGVYSPVDYVAVHPSGQEKDAALAAAAVGRLRSPEHQAAGSRLLVRAGRVEDAEQLVGVYEQAGARVGLVVGRMSWPQVEGMIGRARRSELDGLVCVAGLIEGFDLPALRIAAYHHPHRTLAPTLQFVGRLARPGLKVRGELLAVPEDIAGEVSDLYHEDVGWAELLPTKIDEAVEDERQVRRHVARATVSGPIEIPPLALRPARSARIYHVRSEDITLDVDPARLGGADVVFRFYDMDTDMVAIVTQHRSTPRWIHSDVLDEWAYELHIVCLVRDTGTLFIASDVARALRDLRELIGAELAVPADGEGLRRLLWAVAPDAYFSVGLRPTRDQDASYRTVAGRRAERALRPDEQRTASLGHVIGGGGHRTFGISVAKAKLWEPDPTSSLLEFRRWCEARARDLLEAAPERGMPRLQVSIANRFDAFPPANIIAATLEHTVITEELWPYVDGQRVAAHELELQAQRISDTEVQLEFFRDDESVWLGSQTPDGSLVTIAGTLGFVDPRTGEVFDPPEAFEERPPILLFTDGSSVQGGLLEPGRLAERPVGPDVLITAGWENADVQIEAGTPANGKLNVQQAACAIFAKPGSMVLTDHGTGELADVVVIEQVPSGDVAITLVHCKAAKEATPRRQLADVAEVLTQAARSARWADPAAALPAELLRRLHRRATYCRVLQGEPTVVRQVLQSWSRDPPAIGLRVAAVQPGLDVVQVAGWTAGESLVNLVDDWCRSFRADFVLLGS